ncbi:hypothetical protein PSCICP_50730 [Pseudomonas cichorii]|uniref:Uncharacterized protein n=1 Tax=Pseudomonas cichorii TaxID=36746 RepID=A0ABQ1DVS0_PSECI|nr:hypothetical protein PSCICP_50730 [Pseudomonas cichorii]
MLLRAQGYTDHVSLYGMTLTNAQIKTIGNDINGLIVDGYFDGDLGVNREKLSQIRLNHCYKSDV